jgi:hypothetical protein
VSLTYRQGGADGFPAVERLGLVDCPPCVAAKPYGFNLRGGCGSFGGDGCIIKVSESSFGSVTGAAGRVRLKASTPMRLSAMRYRPLSVISNRSHSTNADGVVWVRRSILALT